MARWHGTLGRDLRGKFRAESLNAELQGTDFETAKASFAGVKLQLWSTDTGLELLQLEADSLEGTWPEGPCEFKEVAWTLPATGEIGQLRQVAWSRAAGFACGGCKLEGLSP